MNVFLFQGQGSQSSTMLDALRAYGCPDAFHVLDEISDVCGYDLAEKIRTSSNEELKETTLTQIAVFATDLAYASVLRSLGIRPDMTAGHSLGEYAALVEAGVTELRETASLILTRSELMSEAAEKGCLCAVRSPVLDAGEVRKTCEKVEKQTGEIVSIALYNSRRQVVVGGTVKGVRAFMKEMEGRDGISLTLLNVSQAFHTELMRGMSEKFRKSVAGLHVSSPRIPVILNCTGTFYPQDDAEGTILKNELISQCVTPVNWTGTMQTITDAGQPAAFDIGPGRTLSGFFRNFDSHVRTIQVQDRKAVTKFIREGNASCRA